MSEKGQEATLTCDHAIAATNSVPYQGFLAPKASRTLPDRPFHWA
jgi:hypothetical protein